MLKKPPSADFDIETDNGLNWIMEQMQTFGNALALNVYLRQRVLTRDRFYKTPFWPKTYFFDRFSSSKTLDKLPTEKHKPA
jgi:hypothetical protein